MKQLLLALLLLASLWANGYNDDDLDGVPNHLDRCPATPFSDIVDEFGCSIERLIRPRQVEFYLEYLYARDGHFHENGYLANLTLYRGPFDFSLSSLYFNNPQKAGFSDVNIRLQYLFHPTPMWDLLLGVGIDLPTYNVPGNRSDYALYWNNYYYLLDIRLLFGLYHIYTTDRYGQQRRLKNSYGGYGGIEYFFGPWSLELSYLYHKSKFGSINNLLYLRTERRFQGGLFLFATGSKALNNQTIDHVFSLGFGYRF
ncbi:MAG: hypothetical protein C6I00_05875 [Nitratiruptor sp.]|nr:hypothetical protein [Nitratiruptor sp.]NPA83628.1 hypothetical protein [Campylobacterota bacterium]